MSGICGIVNFDGAPVDPELLRKMTEASAYRGPDGIRYWIEGNVGFAHLALNTTPESLREQQPLLSADGLVCLTADARVDNRDELIRTLTAKGHLQEKNPTDADLILAAYQCWGEACPEQIIGDFAFVIWNTVQRHVFAARDAMGMRAFYYRIEPRRFLFATEVKQILTAPNVPARIFEPAVAAHLATCAGLPEWTFYEGIAQLPSAHAFLVDAAGSRTWRYWDIDPDYCVEYADEAQYADHLREILTEAVRCRLRSVKPVGIFLSGGMDSGSVASIAGWLLRQSGLGKHPGIRAYCWVFDELTECDERSISDRIVQYYELPVTYMLAEEAWPLKDYPAYGPDQDEPYIGHYQVLHAKALREARTDGMGQMFTGRSGDLMVGGTIVEYVDQLRAGKLRSLWRDMWADSKRARFPLYQVIGAYLLKPFLANLWPQGKVSWLRRVLPRVLHRSKLYPRWVRPEFAARVGLAQIVRENVPQSNINGLARRQRYERVFAYWQSRTAVWLERTYTHFGLGFGDPWGDQRIASFVLAVPQRMIHRPGEYKWLSRRAMYDVMPEEARRASRKTLIGPLYERAIREQACETVLDLLTDSEAVLRGYVSEDTLHSHYELVRRGEVVDPYLYQMLTLEMWLRRYWQQCT
ncbi:MAG: hypothetical protein FJ014_15255 [Chloroflexi bacterium]|nr:hypothetical protein [Chloroflexota bacterium]